MRVALRSGLPVLVAFLLALAAALPTQARQAKPAAAATYAVDSGASRIYVKVRSATRLGHEHGVEGSLKSGKLTLGGKGELVFDMASLTADTAEARKRVGLEKKKVSANEAKKVTDAMRGTDVLDVAEHPTATYRIASIAVLGKQAVGEPGSYRVEGRFTLHATEQKLGFEAKVERGNKKGWLRMTGTFKIKQTDYGIKPYSALGGVVKVADELEITGDLALDPKPGK